MEHQQRVVADRARSEAAREREMYSIAYPASLPLVGPQCLRIEGHAALLVPSTTTTAVLLSTHQQLPLELDDAEVFAARLQFDRGKAWTRRRRLAATPVAGCTPGVDVISSMRDIAHSSSRLHRRLVVGVEVGLGLRLEGLLAARCAEIEGLPFLVGRVLARGLVDVHATDRILSSHHTTDSTG